MAQYANTVAADRSFPLTPVYYQGTGTSSTTGGSAMPMTVSRTQPPHHQSVSTWPQYFAESPLLPPPSAFTTYIPEAGSSTSPSSYASSWQNNVQPSIFATGSGIAPSFHRPIDAHPVHTEYQPSTQSLTITDYPTSSQRTILPPSPPQVTTTFPPTYGFRTRRIGSPSSHASTSDYGTGTKGWESPCLNAAEERYTPSHMGVVDGDESVEQITEDGSRQPSVPASTTTSSSSHPSVKLEPDDPDGCFIMELSAFPAAAQQAGGSNSSNRAAYRSSLLSQSLAPPTEVPLRATGASKEMRRMMGVFRLNPFAMHSLSNLEENSDPRESPNDTEGGTEASWCGEGQPLQEEPVMFEFQLKIDGLTIGAENETTDGAARSEGGVGPTTEPTQGLRAEEEAQLRSFSPSFELHPDDVDGDTYARQESYPRSDMGTEGQDRGLDRDLEQDQDHDHDRHSEGWGENDYGSRSEVDTNSTTTTRSVHTPLNDSPQSMQQPLHDGHEPHPDQTFTPSPSSVWDAVNEQFQTVEETHFRSTASATLPAMAKVGMIYGYGGIKVSRLHTTTSHPYLRKSLQNHQASHSHSQSLPHPPFQSVSQTLPRPDTLSLLHLPTHHSQQAQAHITHHSQQSHAHISHPSSNPQHISSPHEYQQRSHIPGYSSPAFTSNSAFGDFQHPTAPLSASYMRPGRGPRGEYDDHPRAYPPRNASHDGDIYAPSPETSLLPPGSINAHSANLPQNRRWSLPDTGAAAIGHGMGSSGPFLTGM